MTKIQRIRLILRSKLIVTCKGCKFTYLPLERSDNCPRCCEDVNLDKMMNNIYKQVS